MNITSDNFREIEFALNNPETGMMNDALAALEQLKAERAALVAKLDSCEEVITAAKTVSESLKRVDFDSSFLGELELSESLDNLAAVRGQK